MIPVAATASKTHSEEAVLQCCHWTSHERALSIQFLIDKASSRDDDPKPAPHLPLQRVEGASKDH